MDSSFLTSIAFQLISLFYISIVVIKYYRTEKFQTLDNFVYKILLYCMVLILIVDMSSANKDISHYSFTEIRNFELRCSGELRFEYDQESNKSKVNVYVFKKESRICRNKR